MTGATMARAGARRASNSDILVGLTRMGFIAYGVLHLAVAWLAVQIALGHSTRTGDQSGAFRTLAAQPFGRVILILSIVGLCAMAIWQALLAANGHREKRGTARAVERVGSGARAVIYAALAYTALKVVTGAPGDSADQQQSATAGMMAKPAGVWLVALAGVVVFAVGVGLAWYGWTHTFEQRLRLGRMSARTRRWARRLGRVGYVAKGIAFGIVGLLLIDAAVSHNPAKSRGLDAALHTLVLQPYGVFLVLAVGAGFAAFGGYCFFQSRYRKVGS
jgi:hypothetical protein